MGPRSLDLLLGAAAVLALVAASSRPEPVELELEAQEQHSSGLRIEDGKLVVVDWAAWMRDGPALIGVALEESPDSLAEEVAANVMRRIFPGYPWPPTADDAFHDTWRELLLVVGRAMEQGVKPHLEIVS